MDYSAKKSKMSEKLIGSSDRKTTKTTSSAWSPEIAFQMNDMGAGRAFLEGTELLKESALKRKKN